MCQHRQAVPHVETGIERHWREESERENQERMHRLYEALRPMSHAEMLQRFQAMNAPSPFAAGYLATHQAQMPSGYCHSPLLDGLLGWI